MRFLTVPCLIWGTLLSSIPLLAQVPEAARVRVLDAHWIELRFAPEYPHSRHTQNPLPGNGLVLPAPESTFIKGQAGQGSENKVDATDYRVPVPNFVADAHIEKVVLLADMETKGGTAAPVLDGVLSTDAGHDRTAAAGSLDIPQDALKQMRRFETKTLYNIVNPAEITVEFTVRSGQTLFLQGAHGALKQDPVLLVQTREAVNKPAGWTSNEQSGMPFPAIHPLFDQFLRDTSIVAAPDGMFYMTGTTGGPEMMAVTSDLSVWKSSDLSHWSPVRDKPRQSTVVWNIDRDGTWMKPVTLRDGEPLRPLWAPEIHYLKGTFWIPFSVPRHGVTLLKSTSGKADGPYEIAIKPDQPVSTGIDASLFQDDDGSVYFLYGGGWIAKMKPDMTGLAEPFHHVLSTRSGREIGFEGVYLFKNEGLYTLCAADFVLGEYDTYIATATSLNGPWSERYLAVPHAGYANFFQDRQGHMYSTFSATIGTPSSAPSLESSPFCRTTKAVGIPTPRSRNRLEPALLPKLFLSRCPALSGRRTARPSRWASCPPSRRVGGMLGQKVEPRA